MDNQSLANAIFELTSVMPGRVEPRFTQRKEVDPKIRKAILRLDSFLRYFSKLVTAPDAATLLAAIDKLQAQYRQISEKSSSSSATAEPGATTSQRHGAAATGGSPAVDIVFPLRTFSAHEDNLELRYALRSIEKYLTGYRNIIVVSKAAPSWLRNVTVIDNFDDSQRKEVNFFAAILAAAEQSDADFIQVWCDDFAVLRELDAGKVLPLSNGRDLTGNPGGSSDWQRRLKLTADALSKRDKPTMNFESHTPGMFERQKFIALTEEFKSERLTAPGITCYSLYHNYYGSRTLPMNTFKATFENNAGGIDAVRDRCDGKFYLGYNDKGFDSGVKAFLEQMFSKPSQYER